MPAAIYSPNARFPTSPGTYVLVMQLSDSRVVTVGKLGCGLFQAGTYLYIGSALGPGGLAGRLHRHLRSGTRLHWHVDYLRQHARIEEIWLAASPERLEHEWATAISKLPGASIPVSHFGASDCRCPAHLFHVTEKPSLATFQAALKRR